MEVQVSSLREALELLGPAVPKKATVPALSNVLLKDGQAAATDLDVAVMVELPDTEGQCLIPYRPVSELVKRIPASETLTLDQRGRTLNLSWHGGKASYEVTEPEDFPPLPQVKPDLEQTVEGDQLVSAMAEIADYCATAEERPVLNGVCLVLGEEVEVAAADGFRMAVKTLPVTLVAERLNTVIIPARAIRVLAHIWNKTPRIAPLDSSLVSLVTASKPLELALSQDRMRARVGAVTLVCNLIQGTFPNYRQLIGQDKPLKVKLFAEDLERAVRRVQQVAREGSGIVRLVWADDTMTVSAKGDDTEAETTVPVTADGGPGRTALNVSYLLGYLRGREGLVEMGVSDETSPVLLRHGSSPLVLVMPMFVQW